MFFYYYNHIGITFYFTKTMTKIFEDKPCTKLLLNKSYIIFITENDVMKRNLPIYHINRFIEETEEKNIEN